MAKQKMAKNTGRSGKASARRSALGKRSLKDLEVLAETRKRVKGGGTRRPGFAKGINVRD